MEALFIVLLVLAIIAVLIWLGYALAQVVLIEDQAQLAQQRQALDVEWQALENGRRVNDVFFQARQAMREAEQERRPRS
jgi:predicted Holliday junction resolvase-like endonuclease